MNWIEALILGIVQGLTEYLPVSSSGHLEIANALLGVETEENLSFAVVVHAATVCSTIVVLWHEVAFLFRGLFRFQWNEQTQYIAKIVLSMIPVAVVGLFFKDFVESLFGNSLVMVGSMLLLTALLLTFAYYAKPRTKEHISYKDAFIIGISQACAVMPGAISLRHDDCYGVAVGRQERTGSPILFLDGHCPHPGRGIPGTDKRRLLPRRVGHLGHLPAGWIRSRFHFGCYRLQVDAEHRQKRKTDLFCPILRHHGSVFHLLCADIKRFEWIS